MCVRVCVRAHILWPNCSHVCHRHHHHHNIVIIITIILMPVLSCVRLSVCVCMSVSRSVCVYVCVYEYPVCFGWAGVCLWLCVSVGSVKCCAWVVSECFLVCRCVCVCLCVCVCRACVCVFVSPKESPAGGRRRIEKVYNI